MDELRICPKRTDSGEERKSRAFSVRLIGWYEADPIWDLGRSADRVTRPLWISWCGTEQEVKAFSANVRTGRKIQRWTGSRQQEQIDVPKSARFKYVQSLGPGGTSVMTVYHPGLLHLDPVETGEEITFLSLVPTWWVDEQAPAACDSLGCSEESGREAVIAALVIAYLDRRSPLPIIDDLGFHVRLFRAALEQRCLLERTPEQRYSIPKSEPKTVPGIERAVACRATFDAFGELLREQTALHFGDRVAEIRPRVEPAIAAPIEPAPDELSVPIPDPTQLRLF